MCLHASFLLCGPDSSTMMCMFGTWPGSKIVTPHHKGWMSGPFHRVPWLLLHVRHNRTCFWVVSHIESKRNHKQIITDNHSLNKQKGGKLFSTLPIYPESSTPLSTISPQKTPSQATDEDRLPGPLGPASSGDEYTPIFCLSLTYRPTHAWSGVCQTFIVRNRGGQKNDIIVVSGSLSLLIAQCSHLC